MSGASSELCRTLPTVRIDLSVQHHGRVDDVAIETADPVAFGEVAPRLCAVLRLPGAAQFWCDGVRVAADATVGDAPLRSGALLDVGAPAGRRAPAAVLALHQVGGPGAGRRTPLGRGRVVLGRDATCDVVLADPDVSRRHATITVAASAITIHDLGSANGTWVDGHRAQGATTCPPGAVIRIGDCLFTVGGPAETPAAVRAVDGAARLLRPPRRTTPTYDVEVDVPVRSKTARPRGVQWMTALVPAAAGVVIAWFTDSPQFLLFALLSPVMMLSSSLSDRLHWRRSRRVETASYATRRTAADAAVRAAVATETAVRRGADPDPATLARVVALPATRLWERRATDADMLRLRVGTASFDSATRTRTGSSVAAAESVLDVPYCVSLRDGVLGVAAPADVLEAVGPSLVGQLAALHSPAELRLVLLLSEESAARWSWARWLPHFGGMVATVADEWAAVVADLEAAVDRANRHHSTGTFVTPWQVVVIDRAARLAQVPGLGAVLARGLHAGITAICLDETVAGLPVACHAVLRSCGETGSRAAVQLASGAGQRDIVLDLVPPGWADALARALTPIVEVGTDASSGLPDACSLLTVLDFSDLRPDAVHRRWAAGGGGADTVIGSTADGPLRLDLVADGPHALVAGTTGAGKSELLQTLVSGLAADHSPDDVNFLLIDYKGGAAFADCALLPHTAGLVTDLDPYLTTRALRSLHSELRRREQVFADAGVADLEGYRAGAPARPLARLVIVVDEFASLAEELPEFVKGLVGVAQRGRSLGVHLVLATQRPGSAVSADIRANTSIRIALRVTDPGESTDVIDAADAVAIERSRPGRAYVRTGQSLTCVQTAHAGSPCAPESGVTVERLGPWRRAAPRDGPSGETELSRLVSALRKGHETAGGTSARSPWLPPLPDALPYASLRRAEPTAVPFAVVDLPDEQRTETLVADLAAPTSLLAVGTARSGRTTMLATVALGAASTLDPSQLHLYVIDAGGALTSIVAHLPHCATALGPDALSMAPRLLHRLRQQARRVAERSGASGLPGTHPSSVLLIDGWSAVVAGRSDAEALECTDALTDLLRDGPAAGYTVIVAGDRSCLASRFASGFATKLVLRLADAGDYALAGIAARDVPSVMPAGRGLRTSDAANLQVGFWGDEPTLVGAQRAAAEVGAAARWAPVTDRRTLDAVRLRPLPLRMSLADLQPADDGFVLGAGGDDAATITIDPFRGERRCLVAGPPRSGRSTVLRLLFAQAVGTGRPVIVAAPNRSPLAALAADAAVRIVKPSDDATELVAPERDALLLIDDSEAFSDTAVGDVLSSWLRSPDTAPSAVVAGRSDDLATAYRGIGAQVRRSNCGLLLRPGPVDGEILGARLPRRAAAGPPGRGVLIGDPAWGRHCADGEPIPIQVAQP